MERALNDTYDFLVDYSKDVEAGAGDDNSLKLVCKFSLSRDDPKSRTLIDLSNRGVTDIDWSQKHPELLAVAYNSNAVTHSEPEGAVLIWSLRLLSRPEYVFHSPVPVPSPLFSFFFWS